MENKKFKKVRIRFNQIDGFIRICVGFRYLTLFGSKNMMLFVTELDNL